MVDLRAFNSDVVQLHELVIRDILCAKFAAKFLERCAREYFVSFATVTPIYLLFDDVIGVSKRLEIYESV